MKALTAACLFCLSVLPAQAEEYKSIANQIEIGADNIVTVRFLKINDDDTPSCLDDGVYFFLGEHYSSAWLDTMILARQSQQLLGFTFTAQDCALSAVQLLPIYSEDGGSYSDGPLEETGLNGNVALLGTNGLDQNSITSSEYYNQDSAAAAFDGYVYTQHMNEDSETKIARGIWLTKQWSRADERVDPWVELDFGKIVSLSGIGIFINQQSLGLGRLPRSLSVSTSDDGEEWGDKVSVSLLNQSANSFALPDDFQGRYIKLEFIRNFGDPNYIEVDEIELYQ